MPDTPSQNPPLDTRLHVLVPAALKERLDELAAEREVSLGAIVREILTAGVFPLRFITGVDRATLDDVDFERWQKMPMVVLPPGGVLIHDGTGEVMTLPEPPPPASGFGVVVGSSREPLATFEAVQAERAGVLGEA